MSINSRKPIPKTQKEISVSQHTPFDTTRGNPNSLEENNRGNNLSFKNDKTKPFSIGIQDIDESVMYYFKNVIKPFVIQNGNRIEVPLIYGSPEKWKSFQKDGYYRDAKGKIMAPIIMFKRDSIEKVRTIGNKLDSNNPNNIAFFQKKYSPKNVYDNFSLLTNSIPEKTNHVVVIPDYITITYNCIIHTYYTDQLNKIIEAIEYASDSYWGDPSRFKFKTMIDSYRTTTELSENNERIVKCNFDIKLNGYIIPEVLQKDLTAIKKIPDVTKIIVTEEVTDKDFPKTINKRSSGRSSSVTVNTGGTIFIYIDGVLQNTISSNDLNNEVVNIIWT